MAKKKIFELPYIGSEDLGEYHVLYGVKGNPIVVLEIQNPVVEHMADLGDYLSATQALQKIIKNLGEEIIFQKTDIVFSQNYTPEPHDDFLQDQYLKHFKGRSSKKIKTYISITPSFIGLNRLQKYSKKGMGDFMLLIDKIFQILKECNMKPMKVGLKKLNELIKRFLTFNFDPHKNIYVDNLKPTDNHIIVGERFIKNITLVDTELMGVPSIIKPVDIVGGDELKYPVDNMRFLLDNNDYEALVYNQVIEITNQKKTVSELAMKARRSKSVKDESNTLAVEDIESIMTDMARENQIITRAHFNMIISCLNKEDLDKTLNYIESTLYGKGIIIGRNSFNQMQLFRTALFGNANEIDLADLFYTTADAGICFFLLERKQQDEISDVEFFYTDREGVPLKIDMEDLPMIDGRINNRNKFVLGPSGSGKSFFVNSYIAQLKLLNTDIVIVDTGDSYIGINSFYNGKYITWKENSPITMNPFLIEKEERNLEKYDFIKMLIFLIFKNDGMLPQKSEEEIINRTINEYYQRYFDYSNEWVKEAENEDLIKYIESFSVEERRERKKEYEQLRIEGDKNSITTSYAVLGLIEGATLDQVKTAFRRLAKQHHPDRGGDNVMFNNIITAYKTLANLITDDYADQQEEVNKELVLRVKEIDDSLRVEELSFNSFYEFSCKYIPILMNKNGIEFDIKNYSFVLSAFYKGGRFETVLNENSNTALIDEPFIVFEIDNIKDNKEIMPIVILVIMDVFIQKMRLKKTQRKALIIEEAWKAIANPLMAEYILFMYKTVRKFWGEAIVVTQELKDIISNQIVKDSILANSDTTILLDQEVYKTKYSEIAELLSLDKIEQSKIFTINKLDNKKNRSVFKEVYIKRGSKGEVYGNEVSMAQYLAFTSSKPEKNTIEIFQKELNIRYDEAIKAILKDLRSYKVTLKSIVDFCNRNNRKPNEKDYEEMD